MWIRDSGVRRVRHAGCRSRREAVKSMRAESVSDRIALAGCGGVVTDGQCHGRGTNVRMGRMLRPMACDVDRHRAAGYYDLNRRP